MREMPGSTSRRASGWSSLPATAPSVPTGLAVAIPEGYAGFVQPRSGPRRTAGHRRRQLARADRRGLPGRDPGRPPEHRPRARPSSPSRETASRSSSSCRFRSSSSSRSSELPGERARRAWLRLLPDLTMEPRIRVSAILRRESRILLVRQEKHGPRVLAAPGRRRERGGDPPRGRAARARRRGRDRGRLPARGPGRARRLDLPARLADRSTSSTSSSPASRRPLARAVTSGTRPYATTGSSTSKSWPDWLSTHRFSASWLAGNRAIRRSISGHSGPPETGTARVGRSLERAGSLERVNLSPAHSNRGGSAGISSLASGVGIGSAARASAEKGRERNMRPNGSSKGETRSSALWGKPSKGERSSALWGKGGRAVALVVLAAVVLGAPMAAGAGRSSKSHDMRIRAYLSPGLLDQAQSAPNGTFDVIVQGSPGETSTAVAGEVHSARTSDPGRGVGVRDRFHAVSGVAAQLTGRQILRLARRSDIRAITSDAPVVLSGYANTQRWPYVARFQQSSGRARSRTPRRSRSLTPRTVVAGGDDAAAVRGRLALPGGDAPAGALDDRHQRARCRRSSSRPRRRCRRSPQPAGNSRSSRRRSGSCARATLRRSKRVAVAGRREHVGVRRGQHRSASRRRPGS